jgi:divalent metal cation (Fe/Co/Zn/Cd) transporter
MKKTIILVLLVLMPLIAFSQNETSNQTISNETMPWYEEYYNKALETDSLTLISIIVGLITVYFLGKFAFKLIKWAIIILAVILALSIIF